MYIVHRLPRLGQPQIDARQGSRRVRTSARTKSDGADVRIYACRVVWDVCIDSVRKRLTREGTALSRIEIHGR
jgi:hypothetical protein